MGKASSSSCLNFIVCGSDSPVEDGAPEAKGSSDKRGWSFRKKTSRHRVLSNSVIIENPAPAGNTAVSDKAVSVEQLDKKPQPEQQDETCQPALQVEKSPPELHVEKPQKELHVDKSQQLQQTELKPRTSLESKMLETVDTSRSSNTIDPTADETVDAQPELPKSLGTKPSDSAVDPSPEPPKSVEAKVCETELSKTVEADVCETVVEPAPELSESEEIKVTETEVKLSPASIFKPSTDSLASFEPKVCETMSNASAELNICEVASHEVDHKVVLDEPSAVVIQSGVRGYLAQTELSKLRSVVKLQAAIRGHLVRRHAVDTLYCFQGIVKVQNMIRGHCQSNNLGEEACSPKAVSSQTSVEKLLNNAFARQLLDSTPKSKSTTVICDPMKPSLTWTWLERWMAASSSDLTELQNGSCCTKEAQQPSKEDSQIEPGNSSIALNTVDSDVGLSDNNNSILRSDSSFKDARSSFLRSDSSFKDEPSSFLRSDSSYKDASSVFLSSEPSFKDAPASFFNSGRSVKDMPISLNTESSVVETLDLSENEVNTSNADITDNLKPLDHVSTREKMETSYDRENDSSAEQLENRATQKDQNNQSDSISQTESSTLLHNTIVENKEPKLSVERSLSTSEQVDADGKRLAYGSRKASNPAFIAAQSKFKELSSAGTSGRSLSSPRSDNGADHHVETDMCSSSVTVSAPNSKPSAVEMPISDDSKVQIGGSECGTELSVTSTLDSPDRSEAGEADIELKFTGVRAGNVVNKSQSFEFEGNDKFAPHKATDLSPVVLVRQKVETSETIDESNKPVAPVDSGLQAREPETDTSTDLVNGKCVESIPTSLEMEQKPEISSSEKNQMEATMSGTEKTTSAHGETPPPKTLSNSPTNVVSQETTPSSQVQKSKKGKVDKSGSQSHPKRSSISGSKKSPSHNRAQDSIARSSSAEHVAKDQKSDVKRRNSFGSTKMDNDAAADQEPRDSTSSVKVLPRYMQATQTARAKAQSPRSSPDVHENKDTISKKRHSLPGATGRHGSPRVEQSPPQAQQPTKSSGNTPTSQERKWVR